MRVVNAFFLYQFAPGYFSPWVTSFTFSLDAILLLNGVHIAYTFMNKMEKDGRVSILKMYIHRYLKVTPYVGILIYFLLALTPYSSDGPYFKFFTEAQVPQCETYFWSAVLHVQNYVNPESLVSNYLSKYVRLSQGNVMELCQFNCSVSYTRSS